MRLWSIHPRYLDKQGLLAVWREALLAQSVLVKGKYIECPECEGEKFLSDGMIRYICPKCKGIGKIKTPYYNHPQLEKFKKKPIESLKNYLYCIYEEATKRGYNFDVTKINLKHEDWICDCPNDEYFLTVTKGQLIYEFKHLQKKLWKRDRKKCIENATNFKYRTTASSIVIPIIEPHPLFKIIEGDIESWEKIK